MTETDCGCKIDTKNLDCDCGCEVQRAPVEKSYNPWEVEIIYCPLHKAAGKLRLTLERLLKWIEERGFDRPHDPCGCSYCEAKAAIREAEGK